MVFRKSVEDADYFVGLIFKVDARKEGGGRVDREFSWGKKGGKGSSRYKGFLLKSNLSVLSFFCGNGG